MNGSILLRATSNLNANYMIHRSVLKAKDVGNIKAERNYNMSKMVENKCVDCGLPCLLDSCPYYKKEISHCDYCGYDAIYRYDGEDYCEECIDRLLQNLFDEFNIMDKAEMLGVEIQKIE